MTHGEVRSVSISLCTPVPVIPLFWPWGFLVLRMAAASGSHWKAVGFLGRSLWERVLLGGLHLAEEGRRGGSSFVWSMQNMQRQLRGLRQGKKT